MPYDITPVMNSFREQARHLWMTCFLQHPYGNDAFINLQRELFAAIVVSYIGHHKQIALDATTPLIRGIPSTSMSPTQALITNATPQMVVPWRALDVKRGEITLHFSGFFDWDEQTYRSWEYYAGVIAESSRDPTLIGKRMLIPCQRATVYTDTLCLSAEDYQAAVVRSDPMYRLDQ